VWQKSKQKSPGRSGLSCLGYEKLYGFSALEKRTWLLYDNKLSYLKVYVNTA